MSACRIIIADSNSLNDELDELAARRLKLIADGETDVQAVRLVGVNVADPRIANSVQMSRSARLQIVCDDGQACGFGPDGSFNANGSV